MPDFMALWSFMGLLLAILIFALVIVHIKKKGNQPVVQLGNAKKWIATLVLGFGIVGLIWNIGILSDIGFGAVGQIPPAPVTAPTQPVTDTAVAPQTADTTTGAGTGEITRVVGGKLCRIQSDGDNSVQVAVRNAENSSLAYLAASIVAETDPQTTTLDSATSTAGTSLTYQTLNVQPCLDGYIYVLADSGVGESGTRVPFNSFGTKQSLEILTAAQEDINVQIYDRTFTKFSGGTAAGTGDYAVSTLGSTDGSAYVENTSFDSGSSYTVYYDFQVNGTAAVYGTYGASDGIALSFDTVDASKFSPNALTLQQVDNVGLTKLSAIPGTLSANRDADAVWSIKTLKSGVTYRIKGDLQADRGDPVAAGDSPILYVDDKVYFRDTDGKIKYDFFDSAGANKGMGGLIITHKTY